METIAIADAGGITGNVGSCQTQTTSVYISAFTKKSIVTNSCTGQATEYPTFVAYDDMILWAFLILLAALFLIFVVKMIDETFFF